MRAEAPGAAPEPRGGLPGVPGKTRGLELARHWLQVDRPERALEEIGRLPGDEALGLSACLIRAVALLRTEQADAAKAAAVQALNLHGPDPALYECLAAAHRRLDELAEAERALLNGLALDPGDVDLLCAYAEVCLSVGQLEKAESLVDRAAAAEPSSEHVATARVLVSAVKGRHTEAYQRAREALGRNPDSVRAHAVHSLAATDSGKLNEARRSSDRIAAETGDADLIAMAREDRVLAHPLLIPLWPVVRFGPLQTWVGAVVVLMVLRMVWPAVMPVAAVAWVSYAVYSWVAPPLVRWYLARRAGV